MNFDEKEMSFTLDIRYPKNAEAEVVDASVVKHVTEAGFGVREKTNAHLLYVPKDSELVTKLMKVFKEETGRDDKPLAIGGGTYAKEFPNMVAFGPCFVEDPAVIHQPNERVEIDKLMQAIQITAAGMYELAVK